MSNLIDFPPATFVSTNGITLEVFEAGQENHGNPIVLCHGWPELAYSWRYQVPALVRAGYHVIVPNQRGYGGSDCPEDACSYDIAHLTDDLVGLLDHFGYEHAIFCGNDWGANVVWGLALLHPDRVTKVINFALPYQVRTPIPWIEFLEECFGPDHYFVHFNRQPGVADRVLDKNVSRFLGNLFRQNIPLAPPEPGNMMINLALAESAHGEALMDDKILSLFTNAFENTGFTSSVNWYRNLDRNWHLLSDVSPVINHPTLMIYGEYDMILRFDALQDFVPNVEEISLPCGHWIQQERPEETNRAILNWLEKTQS